MRSAPRPAKRAAGFTLLELLVVALLMLLIGSMALGGLRTGKAVWDRTEAVAEHDLEALALRRFLSTLLESAAPVRLRGDERLPAVLFEGDAAAMTFVAALPSALAPPGEHLVRLEAEPAEPGPRLVLRWKPLGLERPSMTFADADGGEVLASGLDAIAFRYGGADDSTYRWSSVPELPGFIEIDLSWSDPVGDWPVLVARPHRRTEG